MGKDKMNRKMKSLDQERRLGSDLLVGTWWYLVSITWYCLVLVLVLGQYEALMPVCIEKV